MICLKTSSYADKYMGRKIVNNLFLSPGFRNWKSRRLLRKWLSSLTMEMLQMMWLGERRFLRKMGKPRKFWNRWIGDTKSTKCVGSVTKTGYIRLLWSLYRVAINFIRTALVKSWPKRPIDVQIARR